MWRQSAHEAGFENVVGVVCKPDSVNLPPDSIDLAFICDTYHHFEFPAKTMQSIHQALKEGGQVILIDFHRIEGVSRDWTMEHVRAGQEVFTKEIVDAGFRQVEEKTDLLDESYFIRFEKVEPAVDRELRSPFSVDDLFSIADKPCLLIHGEGCRVIQRAGVQPESLRGVGPHPVDDRLEEPCPQSLTNELRQQTELNQFDFIWITTIEFSKASRQPIDMEHMHFSQWIVQDRSPVVRRTSFDG